MTKEEYEEKAHGLIKDYDDIMVLAYRKQDELIDLNKAWILELEQQYKEYQNKKVRITFESTHEWTGQKLRTIRDGFWVGFACGSEWDNDIYPLIAKIRKDGTAGKKTYTRMDIGTWKSIKNIEIL